ncbi:hypothetical protein [Nocardia goodfellowii]|uniref:Uncharacterized protein n=1 Tax=Nocardia goodfellowii TaxID=882446 RepID=A0ABS4QG75_9NOCA|nr:hypothetical protein [Nocardia goodfellowii]MBP2190682.1 hypothetical protein [Nocardia goodfellowii]
MPDLILPAETGPDSRLESTNAIGPLANNRPTPTISSPPMAIMTANAAPVFVGGCSIPLVMTLPPTPQTARPVWLGSRPARAADLRPVDLWRMRASRRPAASIGFIRSDLSHLPRYIDETELWRLAADFGYQLLDIVTVAGGGTSSMMRLHHVIRNMALIDGIFVTAVLTVSLSHIRGDSSPILGWCDDVVTADDDTTYSRTHEGAAGHDL